jgi:hypothetical protein
MPRHAKATKRARDTGMIRGLRKYGSNLVNLDLGAGLDSANAVAARFQAHLDAMTAVAAAEIAWRIALEQEAALEAEMKALVERARLALSAHFGPRSARLAEFGLRPGAPAKVSAAVKAAAVEKRRATRKARRTLGPKQRKAIKA